MKLDDIKAAVEQKYASLDIDLGERTVSLRNALRLPAETREKLMAAQETLKDHSVDQVSVLRDIIRLVADTKAGADLLIKAAGDDLAMLVEIFKAYSEATQSGEASASRD